MRELLAVYEDYETNANIGFRFETTVTSTDGKVSKIERTLLLDEGGVIINETKDPSAKTAIGEVIDEFADTPKPDDISPEEWRRELTRQITAHMMMGEMIDEMEGLPQVEPQITYGELADLRALLSLPLRP